MINPLQVADHAAGAARRPRCGTRRRRAPPPQCRGPPWSAAPSAAAPRGCTRVRWHRRRPDAALPRSRRRRLRRRPLAASLAAAGVRSRCSARGERCGDELLARPSTPRRAPAQRRRGQRATRARVGVPQTSRSSAPRRDAATAPRAAASSGRARPACPARRPWQGLLACGEMIWSVTIMSMATDARARRRLRHVQVHLVAVKVGIVRLRHRDALKRKVRPGTTTTRCAMSACLCSDGCRLKSDHVVVLQRPLDRVPRQKAQPLARVAVRQMDGHAVGGDDRLRAVERASADAHADRQRGEVVPASPSPAR